MKEQNEKADKTNTNGEWAKIEYDPFAHAYFCSLCSETSIAPYPYCPHCGALMRGF